MRTFHRTIDINASPDHVWAVMSDLERWHEWTASITNIERLNAGPLGVGSKVRVKQPKLAPAVFDVTKWESGHGFEWVTRSVGISAVGQHWIEPIPAGSRVTLTLEFSGVFSAPLTFLMRGLIERYIQMEATGLKRRGESDPVI